MDRYACTAWQPALVHCKQSQASEMKARLGACKQADLLCNHHIDATVKALVVRAWQEASDAVLQTLDVRLHSTTDHKDNETILAKHAVLAWWSDRETASEDIFWASFQGSGLG